MQPHDNAENANQSTGTPASPAQANDYCRQKAGPPGSALYYALLQLPPSKRDAAYAVHAFCQEIADIHAAVHDPGVAHAKLDWWRQELARLFSGAPAHPAARAPASRRAADRNTAARPVSFSAMPTRIMSAS